ncbi:predicted protein [Nematostella vectensis]|uniref:G-protein coupled receptors family 1 profile domain-containing protein n=1 Tax=Nematostella vectensis TaxID=45351 RepID=A7SRV7_NEMVE|nr:predicted protein [Nematostella vectensis]|eukprot:XP_001625646.1 predicted protein [Nematostella vectensis]
MANYVNRLTKIPAVNFTADLNEDLWKNDAGGIAKISSCFIIVLLAVSLNGIIIYTVYKNKSMRRNINFFIVNMCVSDILLAIFNNVGILEPLITRSLKWKLYGDVGVITCKLFFFAESVPFLVSPLALLFINIERYRGISSVISGITSATRTLFLILSWIIPLFVYFPFLYFSKTSPDNSCDIEVDSYSKAFVIILASTFAAIYVSISIVCALIFYKLRSLETIDGLSEAQKQARMKRVRNATKMVMCSLVTFIVLTTPFPLSCYIGISMNFEIYDPFYANILFAVRFLISVNSVAGPCIYLIFLEDFRKKIKRSLLDKRTSQAKMILGMRCAWNFEKGAPKLLKMNKREQKANRNIEYGNKEQSA